jgi:biopolymer transport protein ExbB
MKTTFKIIAAAVSMGVALTAGAVAQQPAGSISELLTRVQRDTREATQENQQREAEFRGSLNQQQTLQGRAQAELRALEAQAAQLTRDFETNQIAIDELDAELRQRQGSFGELFGAARQMAGEFAALIDQSIISAQYPGRANALNTLADSRTLPTKNELDTIWRRVTEEMIRQREVVTFQSLVSGLQGSEGENVDVTRVGPFMAFSSRGGDHRFARWSLNDQQRAYFLNDLPAQPPNRFRSAAGRIHGGNPGEVIAGMVDPSRGTLLDVYKSVPSLEERIAQGGTIGYIIIGMLILSAVFGLFRMVTLMGTQGAVSGQKRSSKAKKGNPLGRVMLAYEASKGKDVETMELKLDEAILRETPKLEFGLNFLKLAAGIAPLLGLLGTVTGMIKTFTQITIFGTGDPKVMAGGISEALMTTVLGLVAAIPLLFIHSFTQSFARGVQSVLEEQAAGLVARHAEERSS